MRTASFIKVFVLFLLRSYAKEPTVTDTMIAIESGM